MAIAVYGRYECHELLGQGGFGRVYRALDTLLEREVALKVVDVPQQGALLAPYLVEPRLLARLRHPHIVDIHGAEHRPADGLLLIDLEWMDSGSVAGLLKKGPLAAGDAVRIVAAILLALTVVHDAGVVHRDVRPANVLLGRGDLDIKLGDFGEAEVLHVPTSPAGMLRAPVARRRAPAPAADTPPVVTGIAGCYPYMAPECFDPTPRLDARIDLWAAGAMLYELLAGRAPFTVAPGDEKRREAWAAAVTVPPTPLTDLRWDVPAALVAVMSRAMAPRDARFASAVQMLEALRDAAAGERGR